MLPLPALAQTAPTQEASGDVKRYCTSIAVAAGDARFAYQTARLAEVETRIKAKVQELDAKTAEVRGWIQRRDAIQKQAAEKLVGIYAKMRPETAATQIVMLDDDMAAAILGQLTPRQASAIFNELVPERAGKLAAMIAGHDAFDGQEALTMTRFVSLAALCVAAGLAGCATRPQEIGHEPVLAPVGAGLATNIVPHEFPGNRLPPPQFNSLYQDGASLYRDPRAMKAGDVLTIAIAINDKATLGNNTDRSLDSEVTNKFDAGSRRDHRSPDPSTARRRVRPTGRARSIGRRKFRSPWPPSSPRCCRTATSW